MSFNKNHPRARRARLASRLAKIRMVFPVLGFVLLALGVAAWYRYSWGASVLGSGILILLPWIWYELNLKNLPTGNIKQPVLEEILSQDVLGRLKRFSRAADLWQAINGTWQQRFFSIRYGVTQQELGGIAETLQAKPEDIVNESIALASKKNRDSIGSGLLLFSMIKLHPQGEQLLATKNLSIEELENSVDWLHHTEEVLSRLNAKVRIAGGVAREWTS